MSTWSISGQYMETCNCSFLCPCITSNLTAPPTEGDCKAAIAMRIDQGRKGSVDLGGLAFMVLMQSPGPMADGNITVGLVIDERASTEQADAIQAIASGAAGGPMAALGPLVGRLAGIERRPIEFGAEGLKRWSRAGELVDQACEGFASVPNPQEGIAIDNTVHPVQPRISLARGTRSRFHAFGIDWEDDSGSRNGHFSPFAWSG